MQTTKNSKNKKRLWLAAFLFLAVGFLVASGALGAESSFGDLSISNQLRNLMSRPEINMGSERPAVTTVIGQILYGFLGFLGVISLLLTIYAGIKWMLAEGNEESISESKKIILYAMVGLAVIMGAYAMTSFVIGKMWESLQSGGQVVPVSDTSTPSGTGEASGGVRGSGPSDKLLECYYDSDCDRGCPGGGSGEGGYCVDGQCYCR